MVAKSAAFEKAVTESRKLKAKPTQDELLEVRHPLVILLPSLTSPSFDPFENAQV